MMRLSVLFVLGLFSMLFAPPHAHAADAGSLVKGPSAAVYYVGSDGRRHAFPNEGIYRSWYSDFSGIRTLSAGEIAALPLGSNVTYRPGSMMVKLESDPKTYAVDGGSVLRWVQDETVAAALYGANWNRNIHGVSDILFSNYEVGQAIADASSYSPSRARADSPTIETEMQRTLARILQQKGTPSIIRTNSDYLIIAADGLAASAGALKTRREGQGRVASLVRLSEISAAPTADIVDAWIERFRTEHPQLRTVVLIGDLQAIPSYPVHIPTTGTDTWSDLKYGLTNAAYPGTYLPNIAVGRIPARTSAELEGYIAKMASFEERFRSGRKAVFFGHPPELSYAVDRDAALARSAGYETVVLSDPTEGQLFAALNDGTVALVLYYGHGSWYGNLPLTQENVARLTATQPFLFLTGGCGFGDSAAGRRTLAELMTFGGSGTAAAFGASNDGGYGYDYIFLVGVLNTISSASTLGDLFYSGLAAQDEAARAGNPSDGSFSLKFTERMSLLGDPGMRLR